MNLDKEYIDRQMIEDGQIDKDIQYLGVIRLQISSMREGGVMDEYR